MTVMRSRLCRHDSTRHLNLETGLNSQTISLLVIEVNTIKELVVVIMALRIEKKNLFLD
jgi:hypothetical protein